MSLHFVKKHSHHSIFIKTKLVVTVGWDVMQVLITKQLNMKKKPRDQMRTVTVGVLRRSIICFSLASGMLLSEQAAYAAASFNYLPDLKVVEKGRIVQEKVEVSGVIKNAKSEPLAGVTVVSKSDAALGAITDVNGYFSLRGIPVGTTLTIRYVNHITQEIVVNQSTGELSIVLQEQDANQLEQVVVVGYGTTSLKKNTSAIASFDAKTIENLPFSDMGSALQGKVAGVIVQQGSAEPGQNGATISIRGNGAPLYVIDGFISSSQQYFSLNKADILSMTILKDAASTAVYGMNAGNGVVLVTTKKGEAGTLAVNYQANFAWSTPSYQTKRMNAYQYAKAINNLNQSLGHGMYSFKTKEELDDIQANLGDYTNWEDELTRKFAPQKEHSLSLTGGTDRLRFMASLNALNQQGIYKHNSLNYNRYQYRTNISSTFDKIGLILDLGVHGFMRNEDYPPASAYTIYSRVRDRNPFEKPFTSSGQISNQFDNPALVLLSPGYIKLKTVYNQVTGGLTWNVPNVEGLTFGFNGNFNIESQDRVDWIETATYYDEEGNPTYEEPSNIGINRSSYMNQNYDVNFRVDYRTVLAQNHNIEATVVQNIREYYTNDLAAGSRGFFTTAIKQIQKGDAELITASNGEGKQAWMGYVGKFHYDYKQRYMFGFSGRYDGSDNFAKDKRWGFFPSFSGGWALSEESFFANIKERNIFNFVKLRGSWGEIGLNNVDHWKYAYLPTYNYNTNGYVVDGKLVNTVTPGDVPSVNMTWFTRRKLDLGVDFLMFGNKLEGSFDYFFETTTDSLASADSYRYTEPLGFALPKIVSEAEYRLEGFDGHLKYKTKLGNVDFNAGFNFTYYKAFEFKTNEDSVTLANPRIRKQGNYTGYVGTGYIGSQFYTNPNDILNNPKRENSRDLRPGDLWYQDVNGDGKIDGQDQSRFGHNANPTFVYGVDLGASYKGLTVMATIQGTGKRQTYFSNVAMGSEGERRLDFEFQNDNWSPDNLKAGMPRPGNASLNDNNNYASSDFWARDTHYVRLKSLTIAYDFKYFVLDRQSWLRNLTVFASGINLFAFGPSVKYGDPEAGNFDGYAYPMMRTYSAGMQLGF